jgi:hypothetical protein
MGLVYEENDGTPSWRFMDINIGHSVIIPAQNTGDCRIFFQALWNTYHGNQSNQTVYSIKIITTGANPEKDHIIDRIDSVKIELKATIQKLESNVTLKNELINRALVLGDIDLIGICDVASLDLEREKRGEPSFIFVVVNSGNLNGLNALYRGGVSLFKKDKLGCNIAHFSVGKKDINMINWLLIHQPELFQQQSNKGSTPIDFAINSKDIEILSLLIEARVMLTKDLQRIISQGIDLNAAMRGNIEFLSELNMSGIDLTRPRPKGMTPLYFAQACVEDQDVLQATTPPIHTSNPTHVYREKLRSKNSSPDPTLTTYMKK